MQNKASGSGDLQGLRTGALLVIAAVALALALDFTKAALVPLVYAVLLYALISEATDWFAKTLKWPRMLSLPLVFVVFLGFTFWSVSLAISSVDTFVQNISQYQFQVQEFLVWVSKRASQFDPSFDVQKLSDSISQLPILNWATGITGFVLEFIGNLSLVLIFLLFFLLGEQKGRTRHPYMLEIRNKISSFVVVKTFGSLVISVAIAILLAALKIEMVFLFAFITFIGNYVPNLGSLVSLLLPVPVIMLKYGAGMELWVFLILSIVLQTITGNFLETKLMGVQLDLHPITILVFLIFWGLIWGVAGMFVAVPITYVLKWGLSKHPLTHPVSEILAGRLPQP